MEPRYATPVHRLIAALLDGIVVFVAARLLAIVFGGAIASVVALTYFVVLTALYGRTIGKMLTGLRVVRRDGSPVDFPMAALREVLGKFLSGLVFGFGYAWALWDSQHQGFHDKLADTIVVRDADDSGGAKRRRQRDPTAADEPPPPPRELPSAPEVWVRQAVERVTAAVAGTPSPRVSRPVRRTSRIPESHEDATLTILFANVMDAAELTERLGDDASKDALRGFESAVRRCCEVHDGHFVKSSGDRWLLTFRSSIKAIRCGLAIRDRSVDDKLHVGVGVHAGEVIHDAGDVHGRNVVAAARITAVATAGTVLVSSLVKELVEDAQEFAFSDGRETELKDLSGTYRVYEVLGAKERG